MTAFDINHGLGNVHFLLRYKCLYHQTHFHWESDESGLIVVMRMHLFDQLKMCNAIVNISRRSVTNVETYGHIRTSYKQCYHLIMSSNLGYTQDMVWPFRCCKSYKNETIKKHLRITQAMLSG